MLIWTSFCSLTVFLRCWLIFFSILVSFLIVRAGLSKILGEKVVVGFLVLVVINFYFLV